MRGPAKAALLALAASVRTEAGNLRQAREAADEQAARMKVMARVYPEVFISPRVALFSISSKRNVVGKCGAVVGCIRTDLCKCFFLEHFLKCT